ncbi:MAG: FAD-binding oxidoreductase [Parachlamydiaceae bacterium]|nr:FAD-binding oxidoreductase [Parachlamydiaceae bacterium]
MKIAILGAGFCGMAVAWNLLQLTEIEVTIFDPKAIAKGTSGIAAGLLHPYVGAHSKINWKAIEGMGATCKLLRVAEQALGKTVAFSEGMLRLALTDLQQKDFNICANLHNDIHWRTEIECQRTTPHIIPASGIFIDSAITVDCESYLQGLWKACSSQGAIFEQRAIASLNELQHFDRVVICMGANTTDLPELKHLPIKSTKGQILEFLWPNNLITLPYPINSHAYLLMNPQKTSCIAGATYEKQFTNETADIDIAKQEILPKVRPFFPQIDELTLVSCRAGIRAGTPDRKPLIAQITDKCWVLTGMGSKGLLYHALFAEELVDKALG